MKTIKIVFFTIIFSIFLTSFAFATPSPNWYQENGRYKLKDNAGNVITNAWVCDDMDDGKPWYLLDLYGNMVAGLAQDHGLWYMLDSDGKLIVSTGYYDDIYLDIDSSGVIKNTSYISYIIGKYGHYCVVNTNNSINTSSFLSFNMNTIIGNVIPASEEDFNSIKNDILWKFDATCDVIEHVLSEFDSSNIAYHKGRGLVDATTVTGPSGTLLVMSANGETVMHCWFKDMVSGIAQYIVIYKTPKNIRAAIHRIR